MAVNFDEHIRTDHDEWKYIYYILYLKNTGENDLSGLEYFAWTQVEQKKTEWIPIGNTKYMVSNSSEQLMELDKKMEKIEGMVETAKKNVSDIWSITKDISHFRKK